VTTELFPPLQLLSCNAEQVELQLDIRADLPWFNGHFPDAPVLAGVVQLDWAVHYSRQYFPQLNAVLSVEVLKFQQMIRPGKQLVLVLQRSAPQTVLFSYRAIDGQQLASGRLKWSLHADG
jgi:3-hydroxymyristoyl/3-hydroxydecanoyl-(acyl carrier protein) dehydratase